MHPILFHIAGHAVEANGVIYFLAILVAWRHTVRAARRNGWDPQDVLPGVILTVIAAYLGARLHGALIHGAGSPDSDGGLLRMHGLSFFGGLATGSLALVGYLRWKRLPLGAAADALTPIAPVLYGMFRLGCFLNGDDYGPPTRLPWGMRFPAGSPPTAERVHPTQLYEILLMVPVAAWLWRRKDAGLPPGALSFELCMLLGAERFLIEFWRLGDRVALGLTVPQWIALGLLAVGVTGRAALRLRRPASPQSSSS